MDNLFEYRLITSSAAETQHFGWVLGGQLQSGIVLRLNGDLGCGKTCFVKGLAKGLDVPDDLPVTSPTYALMHDFPGRLPLIHVDLYRITDEMDADSIGLWDSIDAKTVVAVEWADRLDASYWPEASIQIVFETRSDESRMLTLIACGLQMINLIKEIGTLWSSMGESCLRDNDSDQH